MGFSLAVKQINFTASTVKPGDQFGVTFHFHNTGTTPTERACEMWVRFEHESGQSGFGDRHTPRHPTDAWAGGSTVSDGPQVYQVPANAPEGTYRVKISLFEPYTSNAKAPVWTGVAGRLTVSNAAAPVATLPTLLTDTEVASRKERLAKRLSTTETLVTEALRFSLDTANASYQVEDLATGVIWSSNPYQPGFARLYLRGPAQATQVVVDGCQGVKVRPNSIEFTFIPHVNNSDLGLVVHFLISISSLHSIRISYTVENSGTWEILGIRLLDHAFWTTDLDDGYMVVPHRLGKLIKADRSLPQVHQFTNYTVHKEGYSMPFVGVVKAGAAVLIDWEDPHTRLEVLHTRVDEPLVGGNDLLALSLVLTKTAQSCTVRVLGRGSYIEIAKAYREVAHQRGLVVPWPEKRREFPGVDKLRGAAVFKPFVLRRLVPGTFRNPTNTPIVNVAYTADEVAQLAEHWQRDLGIDRALVVLAGWIHMGYDNQHPDILPAAPEIGGNQGLAAAGDRIKQCGYLFGLHDNYQDMYTDAPSWNEKCLVYLPDGSPMKGGVWLGGQAYHMVSNKGLELAQRPQNLPGVKRLFDPTAYFIDTTLASPLFESIEPTPQTKAEDMKWRKDLIDYAKSLFGVVGSEEGLEWGVPNADYFEGMLSHKTRTPVEESIVPLFPIVYGDCVHLLAHQSDCLRFDQAKQVLDHILYAALLLYDLSQVRYHRNDAAPESCDTPLPSTQVFCRGDQGWTDGLYRTDRFIKNTYEILSHLNRVTAEMPLTYHEALAPNNRVQLCRYGEVEVVVNYGPASYNHLGTELPAYGFIAQGPSFLAFHATRHNGIEYPEGALFTAHSLDGATLGESAVVRVYHGFGEPCIRIANCQFHVEKEAIVSPGTANCT